MNRLIPENDLYVMLNNGFSQSQIARHYNVSRQAVSIRIKYREKSKHPYIELRQFTVVFLRRLGFLISEIAELTDYTTPCIRGILQHSRLPAKEKYYPTYTKAKYNHYGKFLILFLYRIGFTVQEISLMTNYSFYTARSYLNKMGYTTKGRC